MKCHPGRPGFEISILMELPTFLLIFRKRGPHDFLGPDSSPVHEVNGFSQQSCGSAARVPLRDHRKSKIFWELYCKCNSTESFSLRSRGPFPGGFSQFRYYISVFYLEQCHKSYLMYKQILHTLSVEFGGAATIFRQSASKKQKLFWILKPTLTTQARRERDQSAIR